MAPACSASAAVSSLDWSSTTITSATPGAPTIAASSGPIRPASFRAGITTVMVCTGVMVGRTGTSAVAALATLLTAKAPAATRIAIDTSPTDRPTTREILTRDPR